MEWQEETLCDYECKYNLTAYYGTQVIASIHKKDDIWYSVIDGTEDDLTAETLEEAKKEIKDKLFNHFESQINYYEDLTRMLDRLE